MDIEFHRADPPESKKQLDLDQSVLLVRKLLMSKPVRKRIVICPTLGFEFLLVGPDRRSMKAEFLLQLFVVHVHALAHSLLRVLRRWFVTMPLLVQLHLARPDHLNDLSIRKVSVLAALLCSKTRPSMGCSQSSKSRARSGRSQHTQGLQFTTPSCCGDGLERVAALLVAPMGLTYKSRASRGACKLGGIEYVHVAGHGCAHGLLRR